MLLVRARVINLATSQMGFRTTLPPMSSNDAEDASLRELSSRIEQVSDRLEVVAFRKPVVRKPSYIMSPTYAVEIRDRVTGNRFIVSTEELIEKGILAVHQIQRQSLASTRLRLGAMVVILIGAVLPQWTRVAPLVGVGIFVVSLIAAALLWRQAVRIHPKELPGVAQQLRMVLRPKSTEPRT